MKPSLCKKVDLRMHLLFLFSLLMKNNYNKSGDSVVGASYNNVQLLTSLKSTSNLGLN